MQSLWNQFFKNVWQFDPEYHPAIVTESPLSPKRNSITIEEIAFETFNVHSISVQDNTRETLEYELPDGKVLVVQEETKRASDMLSDAELNGNVPGLDEANIQPQLLGNVVLSRGDTMFDRMQQGLETALKGRNWCKE